MRAQLYVVEQPDKSFNVYNKLTNNPIPIITTPNLYLAVDFCYNAGMNFEVEILEQALLDFETAQGEE